MGNLNSILQLINPDNTITANRALAHAIGMTETIIYSALISKYTYYESRDMLYDGRWFYCTSVDLQESTTFSKRIQKTAIDNLEKEGLISVMVAGMPAKRYFTLSDDIELLRSLLDKGMEKSRQMSDSLREKMREDNQKFKTQKSDNSNEIDESGDEEYPVEASKINRRNKMSLQEVTKCNFKKEQNVTSRSDKMSPQEVTKRNFKKEQNVTPRSDENAHKSKDNKIKYNEIKSNQSIYLEKENSNISIPKYTETLEQAIRSRRKAEELVEIAIHLGYDAYPEDSETMMLRRRIAENTGLERQFQNFISRNVIDPSSVSLIRETYDVICDIVCNKRSSVKINGDSYDWEMVRSQFLRLGYDEVTGVIDRTMDASLDIKNMKPYLITSLYNASMTEKLHETSREFNSCLRRIKGDSRII